MNAIRNTASVALGLLFAGCMYPGRATREQRLATAAQESARYCDGDTEKTTQEVISAVHEAQPLFVKINTGKRSTATKSYLLGAKLLIEARQGMTAQSLERTLRCHQARRVMEPDPAAELDPFSLANSWIDIQVQPDHSGFIVLLRGQTPEESQVIDARAQEFINSRAPEFISHLDQR
jgi:hypothetical protein